MLSLFVLIYKTRLLVAADHDLPFVLLFSVRKRMTCLQSVEKCAESLRAIPKNGAGEGRFEASYKRQPVTESSYINSLAPPLQVNCQNLTCNLAWTTVRGPRAKRLGPWSTDLEPRIGDLGSRVTGAGC